MKIAKKKPALKKTTKKTKATPKPKTRKKTTVKKLDEEIQDFRIDELKIKNFKAFDSLNIKFPKPRMSDDLDVTVIGSRNGLGKTSILEACVFLFLGIIDEDNTITRWLQRRELPLDVLDLLVHGGVNDFRLSGHFSSGKRTANASIAISRRGTLREKVEKSLLNITDNFPMPLSIATYRFMELLGGLTSEPIFTPGLLYFHSNRKVQEGNPELGMMMVDNSALYFKGPSRSRMKTDTYFSSFKLEILKSIMGRAELFENIKDSKKDDSLEKLNELLRRYAGGSIENIRSSHDNTVDLRITPINGGNSFTFDGLSSGQKEIISTLFLIWKYSNDPPSIVLIDEPELHLNAEWHGDFIMQLEKIAPQNQYIIATHSEDIFASVPAEHRLLLEGSVGGAK